MYLAKGSSMLVLHQKNQILALLILIGALAPLAADAYLPALSCQIILKPLIAC